MPYHIVLTVDMPRSKAMAGKDVKIAPARKPFPAEWTIDPESGKVVITVPQLKWEMTSKYSTIHQALCEARPALEAELYRKANGEDPPAPDQSESGDSAADAAQATARAHAEVAESGKF